MGQSKDKQFLDLDFTDEEYRILDIVAKDINMIQLLYKIPEEKLRKLLKYCKDHCNSYIFRLSLKKPLLNMNMQLANVSYVKLYNRKYNIMIYLFGDDHSSRLKCRNEMNDIFDKLDDLPYLIDVFTEVPRDALKKYIRMHSTNLEKGRSFHQRTKHKKNIRSHESDIRIFDMEKYSQDFWDITQETGSDRKKVLKVLNELQPLPKIITHRIYKQISKIYDPEYKKIIKYMADDVIDTINEYREIMKNMNMHDFLVEDIRLAMFSVSSRYKMGIMDIYVVARIHRDFEKKDTNSANCSSRPHNIIYTAGNYHIDVMKYYLSRLDYEILAEMRDFKNCLPIDDNLPMFHRPI